MILFNKFEKVHAAIKALQHAMAMMFLDSRLTCCGKPGELIKLLSEKERKDLEELTADMMNKYRVEPWQVMGRAWAQHMQTRRMKEEFDKSLDREKAK